MMAALREWLTSIVAVTLLISLAETLVPEGALRKVASFVGGLVLFSALVQPLLDLAPGDLVPAWSAYLVQAEEERLALETVRNEQLAEEVARLSAERIESRAAELGLRVAAVVKTSVGEGGLPLPDAVELKGEYAEELSEWISSELGISESSQVWSK